MREILFSGKRIDTGEWIEGSAINTQYDVRGDKHTYIGIFVISERYPLMKTIVWYEVIPETVGQYTGLTDKNGKKIFEGDIVKHYNHCEIKEYSEDIGRVFYYANTCRFLRTSKLFPDDCPEIYSSCEYEVIGNIHDNPELLKGGGE